MNARLGLKSLIVFASIVSQLAAASSDTFKPCKPQDTPPKYVELITKPRKITVQTEATRSAGFFSSCSITAVKIFGSDPITTELRAVTADDYAPVNANLETIKTILLVPPTGGENRLDRSYAKYFCENGFRVVLVQHWLGDADYELDLGMHDRSTYRSTAALKDAIEYINPKSPNQLGILGASVGAIISSFILGADPRVSAGVLVVGGGGMAEIISQSDEINLAKLRKQRLGANGLGFKDIEEYRVALAQKVKIDPLNLVSCSPDKKVLFFLAAEDLTVPTANQYKLYQAFKNAELHTYNSNHFYTIVGVNFFEKSKILKFLSESL